jgi:biotin operon repressor
MNNDAHSYDIPVEDEDVARLLAARRKPWWCQKVLRHLHHGLDMSLAEIGNAFGITRQSVHEAAQQIGVQTERKRGRSKAIDQNQTRLSEYEQTGLDDFV